mmetsp:Transcript_65949/g.76619  ORF Transcript_65949/g.76619 Transcript_65949/m.76619 type:complete len:248 (-) Transcript_65949:6-749(-)|eukprot:CAMPEP_0176415802 /NCGR_PEP_ID=MMETSP0127-20121128/6004_1 /TAXON_ID=938130 /ORGANISM="Platyophrya macrostoma, Strain WH" /LENGTH=247 /DNA_ID=CAMNT_0017795829 /DNA_START=80 /DNA_END=823 /DNA_ORIENTATION=-
MAASSSPGAIGFELMPSRMTQFLHPTVDPSDRYDPTFIGCTRKAKIPPHLTAQSVEKGKRILAEKQAHDETVLQQQLQSFTAPTFRSDVESHRFGVGFSRRPQQAIQQDRQRIIKDQSERQLHEDHAAARRVSLANRNFSQFDIVTGEPCNITQFYPTAHPASSTRPELFHHKMDWPHARDSSVFPPAVSKTSRPPPVPGLHDVAGNIMPKNRRQARIMCDGLTSTKREWSVAQQLKCGDGYVLPKL